MPQLRQDPATKEWVIMATECSKRPDDFKKTKSINEKHSYKKDCPFCGSGIYINVSFPEETAQCQGRIMEISVQMEDDRGRLK